MCEGFIVTLRYRFNLKRNKILARVRRAQAVRLLTGRWRSSPHLGSVKLGLCGWWRSILTLDFPIPGAFKKTTFCTFVTSLLGELPLFFKMSRSSLWGFPHGSSNRPSSHPPLMGRLRGPDGGPPNFYKENFEEEKETMFLKSKSILNQLQQKKRNKYISKKNNSIWGCPRPTGFHAPL